MTKECIQAHIEYRITMYRHYLHSSNPSETIGYKNIIKELELILKDFKEECSG